MSGLVIRYGPPGPVTARYMASDARVRLLMGPFGSGKTACILMDKIYRAARQPPSPIDGVRRFKFCVVRDHYTRLWQTTIPSWWKWMPKETGEWTGGQGEPTTHRISFDLGQGVIELIAQFVAIGEHTIEDVLRGYEPTSFYLNEADLLSRDVLTYCLGRVGRYPDMQHGGPAWYGVDLDCNAPDVDNWIYETFVEKPRDGFAFFRQPSGLSPRAENVQNLPRGYYQDIAKNNERWWVRRYVLNEFGYSREGKPVYGEFNDELHVAGRELEPIKGLPLMVGLDAGMTPAAAVMQRAPNGQWRALDEIAVEPAAGMGPKRFAETLNRVLRERYPGYGAEGWADPSAAFGADKKAGEQSWIQIVSSITQIRIRAAPTNRLIPRLEAVRGPLTRLIDGETPALVVSPRCRMLRKGFNSGYRYHRVQIAGEERYRDEPEKNEYSHVHDALQYVMLGGGEYDEVMARKDRHDRDLLRLQTHAITEDNPQGVYADAPLRRQPFAITD